MVDKVIVPTMEIVSTAPEETVIEVIDELGTAMEENERESLIVYSKIGTFISFNFINSISK